MLEMVWRELNGARYGVDQPSKDNFDRPPCCVPFQERLDGDWVAAQGRVVFVVGAKNVINHVEQDSMGQTPLPRGALDEANVVIHV